MSVSSFRESSFLIPGVPALEQHVADFVQLAVSPSSIQANSENLKNKAPSNPCAHNVIHTSAIILPRTIQPSYPREVVNGFGVELSQSNHRDQEHSTQHSHHQSVKHVCAYCPAVFSDSSVYQKHLLSKHMNQQLRVNLRRCDGARNSSVAPSVLPCRHC